MALYSSYISKRGPLGQVWMAANYDRNLSKGKILQINIPAAVKLIREAHLLLGLVRVHTRKLKHLADDINEFRSRLQTTIQKKCIALPPNGLHAPQSDITIPESPLDMYKHHDPTLNIFGRPRPSLILPDTTLTDPESLRSSLSPFTLPSNQLRTPMMDEYDFRESEYFGDAADNLMSDIPTVFVTPTNDPDEIRWLIEYAHQQGGYQDFDTFMQTTELYIQRPSEYNRPDSSLLAFQPTTTPGIQDGSEHPEPQTSERSSKNLLFTEDHLKALKSSTKKQKRKRSGPPIESCSNGGAQIDSIITLSDQTLRENQDNTRDIMRRRVTRRWVHGSTSSNLLICHSALPLINQIMERHHKRTPSQPKEYLEILEAINSKTYRLWNSVPIELPVSQTVRTDAEDALAKAEGKTTKENTSSAASNAQRGFDGVFEDLQSSGPSDELGIMDELVTPQSPTDTERQSEEMLTDKKIRDLQSRILACNSPDFNSITNSPHHTMAPSRPLNSTSKSRPPYSDSKTRDMLELVAYQFNKEQKPELKFEEAFKCPQPEKNAPEHLKREWRRHKALAMAALLTFVRDGYVKARQAAPYQPIFVESTNRLMSVNFEKKLTGTHTLPHVKKL
ncbi:putative N terminus of Rad21 / Rec8 like protein [Blattamonas nauphoetae]|uniref:N terminus of Rad21 / Rec8 like protein n=1 Tax=Blattamonas nauphoetae TaxID=2049346 RepID=A0ABQ9WRN4_9EUKA|nr:putative N terminus of Rad21 / Rec8 like protein [Blattamonas nauphoetae]